MPPNCQNMGLYISIDNKISTIDVPDFFAGEGVNGGKSDGGVSIVMI